VYYGYDTARARALSKSSPQKFNTPQGKQEDAAIMRDSLGVAIDIHRPSSTNMLAAEYSEIHSNTADDKRLLVESDGPKRVTDLVLVVHGIGQGVCYANSSYCWPYSQRSF
jgi:hypothetical protein